MLAFILAAALGSAALGSAALGSAALGSAALGSAALGSAAPGSAALGSAALGSAALGSAALGSAAPGSAAPGSAAPGSAAPGSAASGSAASGSAAPGVPATYRVLASVRVSGVPLVPSLELRGDVVLRPGAGPRAVRARLAARGHACELAGTLTPDERLVFPAGQRCPIALADPGLRGEVEATLRSGEGRVAGGRIALALELGLAGSVRVAGGRLPGLTRDAVVPVDGAASVRAEGAEDNSRAAER